MGADTVEKQQ